MRSKLLLCAVLLTAYGAIPTTAIAQGPPEIVNPSVLQPRAPAARLQTMMNVAARAPAPAAEPRDIVYDLIVKYTESQLWNPTENRPDKVKLRSYQGRGVNPDAPFVGPQIEAYPGQTVRMQNIRIAIPDGRGGVAASHH
jgi:L-ascorbate oxidase